MTNRDSINQRIRRRETHSARSIPAITVATALILALAWLGAEIILGLLNQPPWVTAPHAVGPALVQVTSLPAPVLIGAGVVLAIVGVVLGILALAAGRLARHIIDSSHAVTIVDDNVVASALALHAAVAAGIDPGQARVLVSRRVADVQLTPTTGIPIDEEAVLSAVTDVLESYGLRPAMRAPRLSIASQGKVGA